MTLHSVSTTVGLQKIDHKVLDVAAAFDFASIPGGFTHLYLFLLLRTTQANGAIATVVFNGDTGANYYHSRLNNTNTTVSGNAGAGTANGQLMPAALPGSTDTAGRAGVLKVLFPFYTGGTFHKEWECEYHSSISAVAAGQAVGMSGGAWASTAAITRIQVDPSAGTTFVVGSQGVLYGF